MTTFSDPTKKCILMKSVGFCMRFPKMVCKSILHKQMAEKWAVEVNCSDGNGQDE